jgi:AcrR family transcriptional regulator
MSHIVHTSGQQDRRVRRTRMALQDALFALIYEYPYEDITIQHITNRADVNRATFYLHYRDKDDLLQQSIAFHASRLASQFGPIARHQVTLETPLFHLVLVFEHIQTYADIYKVVLGIRSGTSSTRYVQLIVTEIITERLEQLRRTYPDIMLTQAIPMIAHYMAGAFMGIASWWLEAGMPHSPAYMADRMAWLSIAGCYPLLGLPPPSLENEPEASPDTVQ